ncbi:MAG TPA: DUF1937 family protein [Phycisphaerales bacterium]|nr:DUF1937 family protein [Phycisphaerales bacterium]
MKLIYVAGPYRAPSEWQVTLNIREAEAAALELWRMGYAVICPHKNTAYFGGAAPDQVWLDGDMEMLRRCDAVYAMPSWKKSTGATAEISEARRLGIPVFETLDECQLHVNK